MGKQTSDLTAVKSRLSSIEIPTLSRQLKNPEKALKNPSNLSKYLILRELITLEEESNGGVPVFEIVDRSGLTKDIVDKLKLEKELKRLKKLVATELGNYKKWGLVEVVGKVKRPEGGAPFYLWSITDKGRKRFYYFHDRIMQGQDISHRRRRG